MEGLVVIVAVVALFIQYYIIKSAVSAALEQYKNSNIQESIKYDNILIALGVNPSGLHKIDKESENIYKEKLIELKKDKRYKSDSVNGRSSMEYDLKKTIREEAYIRKLQLVKR